MMPLDLMKDLGQFPSQVLADPQAVERAQEIFLFVLQTLSRLEPKTFDDMGSERSEAYIKRVVTGAEQLNLVNPEAISGYGYMSLYLGIDFHTDVQWQAVVAPILSKTDTDEQRVIEAYKRFRSMYTRVYGDRTEICGAALRRFIEFDFQAIPQPYYNCEQMADILFWPIWREKTIEHRHLMSSIVDQARKDAAESGKTGLWDESLRYVFQFMFGRNALVNDPQYYLFKNFLTEANNLQPSERFSHVIKSTQNLLQTQLK